MRLFVREYGSGFPVVILHGLYGSGENFRSFAEGLSGEYRVILPDVRNHGLSPHAFGMNYRVIAQDVALTLDDLEISCCHLIGHSLGGKAAIEFALEFPSRVDKLVAVDIAPKSYKPRDPEVLPALKALNLSSFSTRQSIEETLSSSVPDRRVRLFLMKNIVRGSAGTFTFRIGLDEIEAGYTDIWGAIDGGRSFPGNVLFLRGGGSDFVEDGDEYLIREFFPNAEIRTIPQAGHWVQVDQPEEFASAVRDFFDKP
jgi:esterase